MTHQVPDFSASRILWRTTGDSFALWRLDAKLAELGNDGNSIYLCTEVMAGHVYGEGELPVTPSYHFQAAFSTAGEYRLFRNAPAGRKQDSIGTTADVFPGLEIMERRTQMTQVDSRDALTTAVEAGASFSAAIEYATGESRYRLEFNVCNMNMRKNAAPYFQAETGPAIMILQPQQPFSLHHVRLVQLYFQNFHTVHLLLKEPVDSAGQIDLTGQGPWAFRDFVTPGKLTNCDIRLYSGRPETS